MSQDALGAETDTAEGTEIEAPEIGAPETEAPETEAPETEAPDTEGAEEAEVERACPACGETAIPGSRFCEACGTALDAPPAATAEPVDGEDRTHTFVLPQQEEGQDAADPAAAPVDTADQAGASVAQVCGQCGGTIAADGYCEQCGAPAVRERDHWVEQPSEWVGGVCDRGIRHRRNEDAMALSADPQPGGVAVLVVCDGVTTARDSDVASLAAARAACDVLTGQRPGDAERAARIQAWTGTLTAAAEAAHRAVIVAVDAPAPSQGRAAAQAAASSPPSCTFVAAVVDGDLGMVGWLGDSRAYWLPDEGDAVQVSADDSWAGVRIAMGMDREEAESSPQAHAITRWLGPDNLDHQPQCASVALDSAGWLLVCSDGMWNYCSPAGALRELVRTTVAATGSVPADVAAGLVAWANGQGGHDNVTVAMARVQAGSEGKGVG